jgi:hypothetical protein
MQHHPNVKDYTERPPKWRRQRLIALSLSFASRNPTATAAAKSAAQSL